MDPGNRRSFGTLVAAAFVDGTLAGPERQMLHRKATQWDIPLSAVNQLIAQGEQGKLQVAVPPTREQREALLDDMIDIVTADGRIEAPEHHLLAKFAAHLSLALPDLRARIRERMERRPAPEEPVRPRAPEARPAKPPPAPPVLRAPPAPPVPPAAARGGELKDTVQALPERPSGPVELDGPKSVGPTVGDLPPVTLQLLKQAIAFEPEAEALRYIERTLGIPAPEAKKTYAEICAAFPSLKPGSQQIRGR